MNKKLKQETDSLFEEYRIKYFPHYKFEWKKLNKQLEVDPSGFIYSGLLYDLSEAHKKICHFTLTLDKLISSSIVKQDIVSEAKDISTSLQQTSETSYLPLINPRLHKLNYDQNYGIRLISGNHSQSFLCRSKEDMLKWFHAFKRVCILENIEERYELKQFIGSGSSAIVRIGVEICNPVKTYAIKSFPKKNYTTKVYSFVTVLSLMGRKP